MTTPKNPERLWAAKYRDEDGFEYVTVFEQPEDAEGSHCHGTDARVQAYVREDVAETETAALRRERDALAAERDAVAREGWRACILLMAARESNEADSAYSEADEAHEQGDDASRDRCCAEAGKHMDESVRLRRLIEEYDAAAAGKGVG